MINICFLDLGKNCPPLNLGNGTVEYSGSAVNGSYSPGIKADFNCNEGYSLNGYFFTKCQVSGTWNQQTPICRESKENNKLVYFLTFMSISLLELYNY